MQKTSLQDQTVPPPKAPEQRRGRTTVPSRLRPCRHQRSTGLAARRGGPDRDRPGRVDSGSRGVTGPAESTWTAAWPDPVRETSRVSPNHRVVTNLFWRHEGDQQDVRLENSDEEAGEEARPMRCRTPLQAGRSFTQDEAAGAGSTSSRTRSRVNDYVGADPAHHLRGPAAKARLPIAVGRPTNGPSSPWRFRRLDT